MAYLLPLSLGVLGGSLVDEILFPLGMEDVGSTGEHDAEEDERALRSQDGRVEVEVGVLVLGGVDAKVGDARRAGGAKCDLDAALDVGALQDAGGGGGVLAVDQVAEFLDEDEVRLLAIGVSRRRQGRIHRSP